MGGATAAEGEQEQGEGRGGRGRRASGGGGVGGFLRGMRSTVAQPGLQLKCGLSVRVIVACGLAVTLSLLWLLPSLAVGEEGRMGTRAGPFA